MKTRQTLPTAILGMVAVALLAAGCSSGAEDSSTQSAPRSTATTSAPPTATARLNPPAPSTPSLAPAAAATTDLQDRQHLGHIESMDTVRSQITVDIVQWFTGEDAARAAAADGADELPPPNDYWIRNANPRLRTLAVTPGSVITINTLGAPESGSATKDIVKTLDQLAAVEHLESGLFWLTVTSGDVTRIAEQYLP
jgi:hypothetical protein